MHRKKIIELLENYQPTDSNELAMRNETLDFVKKNEDCFKRELLVGHVTGSAWIVDAERKNVLMMHHRKLNQWFQPGGHCDGESDVLSIALKEANEETGLQNFKIVSEEIFDVDVHLIPERKGIPAHYHYDIRFLLEADKRETLVVTEESNDLAWVSLEKIAEYNNSESILRMARKIS
ncbi:NUDIX hydrolase [Emticicia oligotrophica DSM 17448]|uniref:NUDIX hydrolase n=1 Tax=Emticicia oligotrophica (strain DSM 17448 / CIP 109782 / MTCC 6937 / GPTSA100-15) TaxID=929562 RepID=A0ABM5N668_EMTOG|nr:NUDIX hydrolase [Emticicia oligotrophica]AFK04844.1 NUDIX hydrolase [Emticicia oligotrophica DSM 17448]